jgi:hypothetical protein
MRRKYVIAGAIAIAGVLAVGVPVVGAAAGTAATSSGATTITCTYKVYNQTPTQLSGFTFAYINCPQPFGPGVESATFTATVNAQTGAVTEEGTYKHWYDTGTVHGTYSLRGQDTSVATFKGTFTDMGGTGAFKETKGTGTLTCSTTNAGVTLACTSVFPETLLPGSSDGMPSRKESGWAPPGC